MTMRASRATAFSRLRKILMPVPGDIDAARYPHFIVTRDMIEEAFERHGPSGPPDQPAMQAHGHHLWRAAPSLLIKEIEAVAQIAQELLAAVKSLRCREAHVIGIERIGYDEMITALRPRDPIRQIIGIGIRRIEKTALFHHQLRRIDRAAPGIPAERPLAGDLSMDANGLLEMRALIGRAVILVFDPFEAVA